MKLILLRHAESTSNKNNKADSQIDAELTEKGRKDSENLIPELRKLKIDIFIVSPLKRNLQTIQPFLSTIKNPKIITSNLVIERNLGEFTGSEMGTFQKFCEENNYDNIIYRPKNGESIEDTYERAKKFIKSIKKDYNNKTILICSHKNFLMCLEILIKKQDIKDFYKFTPLKNSEFRKFSI